MYFANPWGLLGLLAIPTIIAIHLFHQRFPPLYVAGAHLWGVETRTTTAGRRRDRLPVTLSLLLEILAALLLTVGLSEPHLAGTDQVVHLVVVLDDSASMQAHEEGEPSPRDLAVAELARRVGDHGTSTRLTLIRSGIQPTLLGHREMPWSEAEAVLARWIPRAGRHEFASAWDEGLQVAGEGTLLFLTDDLPDGPSRLPERMEVMALGRALPNTAISAARWTFDSSTAQGEVFFRIANFGEAAAVAEVIGSANGEPIFSRPVTVDASGEAPLQTNVPGGIGQLEIAIRADHDALEIDNRIVLIEPTPRVVSVSLALAPESRERELVERVLNLLPDLQPGTVGESHLLIGPAGMEAESGPDQWWLGLGPVDASEPARAEAVTLVGPFILDKQHPLLQGVTLDGVTWSGAQDLDLAFTPLISCNRRPLFVELQGNAARSYLMNVELSRSTLDRTPDWPVLLTNLVELRRDALPGLRRWNYRTGEVVSLQAERQTGATDPLALTTPSGKTRTLIRDRNDLVEIGGLDETGVYSIGLDSSLDFAVNFFDDEESNLRNISPGRRRVKERYEPTLLRVDNPYTWLIIAAVLLTLAALLFDWLVVRRPGQLKTK